MHDRADSEGRRYQAIIIGGGPGGAAAATRLAQAGRRVLVLEKESFPRFHIGESLLPGSNEVLDSLRFPAAGMQEFSTVKHGATFVTECGSHSGRVEFAGAPGVKAAQTYHVVRERFDASLLDHCAASGAEVRYRTQVDAVECDDDVVRVLGTDADGAQFTAAGDYVIDASGRAGVLSRALNLRRMDAELRNAAVFSHFRGVERPDGRAAGDIRVVLLDSGGWAWLIPLPDGLTSVGFVFPQGVQWRQSGESTEDCLLRLIAQTPAIAQLAPNLELAGEVRTESDYSYRTTSYAGQRWLLVGDAGSFLDPVFSTGVQLALSAGVEAADAVSQCLGARDSAVLRIQERFSRRQAKRYDFYRRFVLEFYKPGFRALLLAPEGWAAGARALASVLAGYDRPGLITRIRLEILFLIARFEWVKVRK